MAQLKIQQGILIEDFLSPNIRNPEFLSQFEIILNNLENTLQTEKTGIYHDLAKLDDIHMSEILSPWSIDSLIYLRKLLIIQSKQFDVYINELTSIVRNNNMGKWYAVFIDYLTIQYSFIFSFYDLVILEQPFPETYTKNKQIPLDSLKVQLLCPSRPQNAIFGPVVCRIAELQGQTLSGDQKIFNNETQKIEFETNTVSFPLKFTQGTRRAKVHLLFSMQITIADNESKKYSHLVESELSNPLVVITNESQWDATEEILFKWDLFSQYKEVSYSYFCNILQRHFILATKQDSAHPKRALSLDDFDYIHEYYFKNSQRINTQSVSTFWTWFGKTLKEIKYQRYIKELWQNGLIYGCLQRKVVEFILQGQPNGTFIIRFSERHAGQFGIAYVKNNAIKHYLVSQKDIAGSKKTLSDFLSEHPQFVYILRLAYGQDGFPVFCRQTKRDSFEKYYSSKIKEPIMGEDGYDPLDDL